MITANDVVSNLLKQMSLNSSQTELDDLQDMVELVRDMEREIKLARSRMPEPKVCLTPGPHHQVRWWDRFLKARRDYSKGTIDVY